MGGREVASGVVVVFCSERLVLGVEALVACAIAIRVCEGRGLCQGGVHGVTRPTPRGWRLE